MTRAGRWARRAVAVVVVALVVGLGYPVTMTAVTTYSEVEAGLVDWMIGTVEAGLGIGPDGGD